MWHSSFARIKKQDLFLLFARTFSCFGITNKTVTKNPSEPRHSISGSDNWSGSDFSVVLLLLYENLKFAPIFLKDLCHAAAILSQETEKALCLHGWPRSHCEANCAKIKKQSSFNFLGQNGLCVTAVYFSLSSFLSLLTRNYPHEGTCDVTIDNMGYERKIISDPLTLLGDKERESCTRFSGLKCNGLPARVCLAWVSGVSGEKGKDLKSALP